MRSRIVSFCTDYWPWLFLLAGLAFYLFIVFFGTPSPTPTDYVPGHPFTQIQGPW